MVDACRIRAESQPDEIAWTFLRDGVEVAAELTYGELDRRARALAVTLSGLAPTGERALLHLPQGLDFFVGFFGCLYAGIVAVPASTADAATASAAAQRGSAIMRGATPRLVLTTSALAGGPQLAGLTAGALRPTVVTVDELDSTAASRWQLPPIGATTLAYLQYSSGSTGSPKGIAIRHGNLLHNMRAIDRLCAFRPETVVPTWLPLFHDMGLVSTLSVTLVGGSRIQLMSPMAFIKHPYHWLRQVDAADAGIVAPNFAFELCRRRITDRQLSTLDMSRLRLALVGAERVRAETLRGFAERFAVRGFRSESFVPCYGLAEYTLMVTGGPPARPIRTARFDLAALNRGIARTPADGEDSVELVGNGRPTDDTRVVIVERGSSRRCAPGEVGEILVAGPSMADGYFDDPARTAQSFGLPVDGIDGTFLRTGDLGVSIDGELFVTGRVKDLIIVDGANHHPADVEATAEAAHPRIRAGYCAAVAVDDGRRERVVILLEVDAAARRSDGVADEVATRVTQAVSARHGIPVAEVMVLRPGSLPFTTSGKIRRDECRRGYLDGELTLYRVLDASPAPAESST
ncbi:acyl-CoA synthetase [Virgisporangium aliadipatigenens]|uniref:Acyl-CoA synthetase n=1 Tax=Virgisporangium aliadipatigenens TaxID=741659 RepID=A0A8J3YNI4_9ACTN|nr:fatty acyl-AMP ligase [Virgisporangium aliadipatigenens]GIJ48809.1 acyl-CoA synthetase [Virgisporangium aliadipatigenens]